MDMDIELSVDNSGGYTSLYTYNGFFFVWENAPDDEIRKLTIFRTLPRLKDPGSNNAVESVEATPSPNDVDPEYFSLQGIKVKHPASGSIVIERCGTSVRKIVY